MSQSVKQCITVDLLPRILANFADIQKVHLLLHTPLLNKTLYRLLLIHCIYVSVTKPACPAFSTWLNTGSIRSMKVTGKVLCSVVTALTSTLCAALHGQSNVGSICDCKPCGSLDLSVLVEILSGVDSDYDTGPRKNGSVNSRSTLCPIERRPCLPKTLLYALIWLFTFCKLDNFFLLDLASIKTLLACSILWGCERQTIFLTKRKSM